jgi:hypothetical protein
MTPYLLILIAQMMATSNVYCVVASIPAYWATEPLNQSLKEESEDIDVSLLFDEEGIVEESFDGTFPSELYHSQQEPFRSFPCYPKYIHLAQASNVDTETSVLDMTISFSLDYIGCACALPTVLYGGPIKDDAPPQQNYHSNYPLERDGFVRSSDVPLDSGLPLQFNYTSDKTYGQTYQSDWIYHIPISNLTGGLKTYWYRIIVTEGTAFRHCQNSILRGKTVSTQRRSLRGSGGYYLGETKTYTFQTPPLPGQPTTLALVGDLGQTINSARTLFSIYKSTVDLKGSITRSSDDDVPPVSQLLIAGDLSYADSDPTLWTDFLELVEPLARTIPLHVVAGNHEIECDTTTNDIFVPYEHWFRTPNRIRPASMEPISEAYKETLWEHSCSAPSVFQGVYNYGNSFYSYQHGLVYIIVLNSYTNCTKGSVQYEWLKAELENYRKNRRRITAPWLLMSFHAPLYTTFLGHVNEQEAMQMKTALEPLFLMYGVNIVVSGTFPCFNRYFAK